MLATGRGVWGDVSPKILFEIQMLLGYFWGHFWVDTMVSETRRQFHMYEYLAFLPIVSYSTGFSRLFVYLETTPFADVACETNFSLRNSWKEDWGEFFHTVWSCIVSTCHLCACGPCVSVCQATLIGDTEQVGKWGKKWSGWNSINWTGSYNPVVPCVFPVSETRS